MTGIRGVKASASLKPLLDQGIAPGPSPYPRCKSLGLIEAVICARVILEYVIVSEV